jgi:CheY-like chemotaxis protein
MSQQKPDVVITDVIMPGKDGYEVCQNIKQNPAMAGTPVVLMSGVVNRQVAEKAFAVKADELIRKPFQPGDLIGRVKQLLNKGLQPGVPAPVVPIAQPAPQPIAPPIPQMQPQATPRATAATLSSIFNAPPRANGNGGNGNSQRFGTPAPSVAVAPPVSSAAPASRNGTVGGDAAKLKIEILRFEHLVKKLQSELEAEREYARALEEHIKTLQESE